MNIKKLIRGFVFFVFLVAFLQGCLPGRYYGEKSRYGDKWEAVAEKKARAETLFSRFYYLMELPKKEREAEYKKALTRLKNQPDLVWRMETAFLATLTDHSRKGAILITELKEEIGKPPLVDDLELHGVVGLLEMIIKQRSEIDSLKKDLVTEKDKSGKLAHQLKELKNIEKIIYERENNQEQK